MSASANLSGLELPGGWKVSGPISRTRNGSGGTFSDSYEVVQGNKRAFLKAFDFSDAFAPGVDTIAIVNLMTASYMHERAVLEHCGKKRLSRVVLALDHGFVDVPGYSPQEARVYYLIFEKASGDIRRQMDLDKRYDAQKCTQVLKDISVGLQQVHGEKIAHQDTKPSNVLEFTSVGFKIGDFGRSSWQGQPIHHDSYKVAGDPNYAPPELMYGMLHPEFSARRMGTDLYMLGNLAAFLFSGINITAQTLAHLDKSHHPANWSGTYEEALPYVRRAFSTVLAELKPLIDERIRGDLIEIISQLCDPDLSMRGHPKGIGRATQYSLQRYVTRIERIAKSLLVRPQAKSAA